MFEQLEETFDLVPATVDLSIKKTAEIVEVPDPALEDSKQKKDEADRELARDTFRRMIQKSEDMLEALTQIASGTEHPRAFEVAANLVKTITDVASKLDEVSSRSLDPKKGKGAQQQEAPQIQNNNLFVGSSEELMKMIRNGGKVD